VLLLKLNIGCERFYLCRLFTIDLFKPKIVTGQYNHAREFQTFACEDLMTKCLLFTEKLFVIKYSFIFIVLGCDTSSLCSRDVQNRGSRPSVKGRSLPTQLYIAIQGTEGKCSCILTAVTSNICYIIF
jgi:hypothetical protein